MEYNPKAIEQKWQNWWRKNKTYKVSNNSDKPKFYVLDMFPYPSGAGLHVGHPLGYIASDIYSRYKRQQGYNVLHPMGFDAIGLPAEQYALEHGIHPAVATADNIKRYREQLDALALSYDWSRSVETCDPNYYKWTQWIFLQLFNHYYDNKSDKALPISKLVKAFEQSGNAKVQAAGSQDTVFTAAEWKKMSPREQSDVLMNYRLMFRKLSYVNWCEALGTVLSNDEIVNGVSERGGHPVEQKPMLQWSMRVTAYAERLLQGLEEVDFSDALKTMQRNWIGRSEGAQVFFDIKDHAEKLEIYTTRPDTIFGATFMVLAPEHDLVEKLTNAAQRKEIDDYLIYVGARSERDRMMDVKSTTGAFTGAYAVHPFTGTPVPIWISEYVLKGYGTGAIMAVPANDERDDRFATKFGLAIVPVIDQSMHAGATIEDKVGLMINSDFLNGLEVPKAIETVISRLVEKGIGTRRVNYKLRDANFSRQRYWGEPIPIVYDEAGVAHDLPVKELPLHLPHTDDFKPTSGRGPLARLTDWVNFETQEDGKTRKWTRETDTMPGNAGSSWYYFRYMDAHNRTAFAGQKALNYWQQVDFYVGGVEHATGHLMYSRMWCKFLYDLGKVPVQEPFKKLVNQGMIQGIVEHIYLVKGQKKFVSAELAGNYAKEDLAEILVHADMVSDYGDLKASHLNAEGIAKFKAWRGDYKDYPFECATGSDKFFTVSEVGKMSKSKYNVVNPDTMIAQYGTDCFRMYEMFLGPIEASKPWDTKGISGVASFLRRFWSLFFDAEGNFAVVDTAPTKDELRTLHACIKRVTDDVERFSMNTCVSHFMVCVNELKKLNSNNKAILLDLVRLMSPFAPHIAEELWQRMGNKTSVCLSDYPVCNEAYLVTDTIIYPICINGKKRGEAEFATDTSAADIENIVREMEVVRKWTEETGIKKVVIVPGRMVNLVV